MIRVLRVVAWIGLKEGLGVATVVAKVLVRIDVCPPETMPVGVDTRLDIESAAELDEPARDDEGNADDIEDMSPLLEGRGTLAGGEIDAILVTPGGVWLGRPELAAVVDKSVLDIRVLNGTNGEGHGREGPTTEPAELSEGTPDVGSPADAGDDCEGSKLLPIVTLVMMVVTSVAPER